MYKIHLWVLGVQAAVLVADPELSRILLHQLHVVVEGSDVLSLGYLLVEVLADLLDIEREELFNVHLIGQNVKDAATPGRLAAPGSKVLVHDHDAQVLVLLLDGQAGHNPGQAAAHHHDVTNHFVAFHFGCPPYRIWVVTTSRGNMYES